jgi:hypothetical protein
MPLISSMSRLTPSKASCAGDDVVQYCKQRSWPDDTVFRCAANTFANMLGADWTVRP